MPHDRLTDPPGCVGRELEASAPVEAIDCLHETEGRLLDEILEVTATILVLLGDRDRQSNVRLHHTISGSTSNLLVLALHLLSELNLTLTIEKLVATDFLEEQLHHVRHMLLLSLSCRSSIRRRAADFAA